MSLRQRGKGTKGRRRDNDMSLVYVDVCCCSGAISTIRNSGRPRSRLHLLEMPSVFGSTKNLVCSETRSNQSQQTKKKWANEPVAPKPCLANFPIRMCQDVVSMYGHCRCEVMQTVDEIKAACEKISDVSKGGNR